VEKEIYLRADVTGQQLVLVNVSRDRCWCGSRIEPSESEMDDDLGRKLRADLHENLREVTYGLYGQFNKRLAAAYL
jgi:hypothetical protein